MNAIAHDAVLVTDEGASEIDTDDSPPWADPGDQDQLLLLRLVGAVALSIIALAAASSLLI